MRYLGQDEVTQVMGIGGLGEVRRDPDGNLYRWVQGVDGLGNPVGYWRRRGRRCRCVKRAAPRTLPAVQPVSPPVPQAAVAGFGGLGALCQAPDGTVYQISGLGEEEDARSLGQDELMQFMGIGAWGEVRQGPDGNLYQWVQGMDGLGNPIGFWKKLKKIAGTVAKPLVGVAKKALQFVKKPYCIPLQAIPGPVKGIAKQVCNVIGRLSPLAMVPVVGTYYQGINKLCNVAKECGIAGLEGSLMQAPDGRVYQVQGLAEEEELRGVAEAEELLGFGEDEELQGFAENEDLTGIAEDEELRGFAQDEELQGVAEDQELRGFAEDEELQGLDQGYVRENGVSGLEAFVPDQPAGTRWFVPPAVPPKIWEPPW